MEVKNKRIIEAWIVPHLSIAKPDAKSQVALSDIVAAILTMIITNRLTAN